MDNVSSKAAQSSWFRAYEQEVNGLRKASNDKKKILLIIPILLIGGMIALMIKNGSPMGGIYFLGGIGAFIVIIMLVSFSKSKGIDAAAVTRKDLDVLLNTPEDAEEFDRQMKEKPSFQVMNQKNNYVFATKDYLGIEFPNLGDKTYRFIKLQDVCYLHSYKNPSGNFDVEFCDSYRKVLMRWTASSKKKIEELKDNLTKVKTDVDSFE
ncbi:MAG: hypothetical protein K5678_12675 [Acetatifactor sp.]|nr:hypothetical protein [Acetatifactor sp.]